MLDKENADAAFKYVEQTIRAIEQAKEYWQGNVNNELPELLINGRIEVVETIDEFSA